VTFREGVERKVFRAPAIVLLLGLLGCAAQAYAQVESNIAAVTLIARVQESFALTPGPMPVEVAESDRPATNPQGVHVVLNWRLHHGRTFQVGYEVADEWDGQSATLASGVLTPSRILDAPPIFSFMPIAPNGPGPVGAWGNRETDAFGVGGILLTIPSNDQLRKPTLRLRAIIL
jgi:hypothetical protein